MTKRNLVDKIQEFLIKIKGIKNIKIIIGIMVVAILLLGYYTINSNNDADVKKVETAEVTTIQYDDEEQKLSNVLSLIDGVGATEVMINRGKDENIIGVLIIAEGANDKTVCLRINQAVRTALNLSSEQIKIYLMK